MQEITADFKEDKISKNNVNGSIVYRTLSKFSVGSPVVILSFYSFQEAAVADNRLLLIYLFKDFFIQTTCLKHRFQKFLLFELDFRRRLWRSHYIFHIIPSLIGGR
jgi:hypothetical protein